MRETERKQQLQNKEMKMKVLERDNMVHELESALEHLRLQCDRRLTRQQKEHEQKMQLLLHHFKGSSSPCCQFLKGWGKGNAEEGSQATVCSAVCTHGHY